MRKLLLACLLLPALSFAQAPAPTTTTLTQALTGPSPQTGASTIMGNTVFLASRTGVIGPIVPGTTAVLLYVDREAMAVQSVNPNTGGITVERGYLGTQPTAHNSGATVLYGRTDIAAQTVFYTFDPAGACVSTNAPNPWVNVSNANQWTCTGGVWVISSAIYASSGLPAGPTSPNVPFQLTCTPPAVCTPTWSFPGTTVTQQGTTGTGVASYGYLATDRSTVVARCNSTAMTDTIPDGGGTGFQFGYTVAIWNEATAACTSANGSITLSRTSSSTINNATSITIGYHQAAYIYLDPNNNWLAVIVPTNGGAGTISSCATANALSLFTASTTIGCGNGDFTYATHTLTGAATGIMNLSAFTGADSFRIPFTTTDLSGAAGGGVRVNSTTGAFEWDSSGGRFYAAAAGPSSTVSTVCTNQFISAMSGTAGPTCSSLGLTQTSQKAETGSADANVLTFTPPAAIGTYRACVIISVSSATSGVIAWTLSWTDSNGTAQSNIAQDLFQDGTAAPATTYTVSAAGNYHFCREFDTNNAAASVIVKWVGGGTTAAKMSATIEKLI